MATGIARPTLWGATLSGCVGAGVGWWVLEHTRSWQVVEMLPSKALAPLLVAVPVLWATHRFLTGRYGDKSAIVCQNTAFGIGIASAVSVAFIRSSPELLVSVKDDGHAAFGVFGLLLCFYHAAEFTSVAVFNPPLLSNSSFLFSTSYSSAMLVAVIEYFVEARFAPWLKGWAPVTLLGLTGCVLGEALRKLALIQAGHNFTHLISDGSRRPEHRLVTHGVYSISRHPGYLGWFWWSVSSQVLLGNPLAACLFAFVSFQFFKDRIGYEEYHLERFFPGYAEYRERVPTRIPFIP